MTADEVLKQMQNSIYMQSNEQVYCAINPETRTIEIPDEYSLLGVESDEKAERIWFQCPKIVGDNIDLSKLQIRVNYQNSNNETDQYIVTDVQTEGNNIIFSWLLSRKVTAYQGNVSFIVCAVKVSGETIQNEWNTTLATAQVLQGLEVDDPEITEEESDVIAQLLQIMTDTSEQAVSDVNTAKTSAISAITSQQQTSVSAVQSAQSAAVSAVENAGKLIEESLPSDYTELSNKVDELDRTKAPAITESTSGESIQLSDSGDAPLTDIKLYGKSKQVTTTGAQLYDKSLAEDNKYQNSSISGGNFSISNNVYYWISGKIPVKPNTEYTVSIEKDGGISGAYYSNADTPITNKSITSNTFTTPESCNYICLTFPKSQLEFGSDIMLNAGSSALPWEPYTDGQPSPSPDYPQEIEIPGSEGNVEIDATGAQLLDNDIDKLINNVYIRYPGGAETSASDYYSTDYIPVSGTNLIVSGNTAGYKGGIVGMACYSASKEFLRGSNNANINIEDAYYLRLSVAKTDINTFMVNYGSSALPWEPYKHTSATLPTPNGLPGIPVTSGGNYTDADGQQWVCDEIDFKRGKYVQRVRKYIFDGSSDENWSVQTNENITEKVAVIEIKEGTLQYDTPLLCNISKQSTWSNNGTCFINEWKWFSFNNPDVNDIINNGPESWKTYLQTNNIELLYCLKTPVETDLTTEQLTALKQILTYQTVTNITTDSDPQVGMKVEYTADTKTYIDNKFAELAQSLAATQNTLLQEV